MTTFQPDYRYVGSVDGLARYRAALSEQVTNQALLIVLEGLAGQGIAILPDPNVRGRWLVNVYVPNAYVAAERITLEETRIGWKHMYQRSGLPLRQAVRDGLCVSLAVHAGDEDYDDYDLEGSHQ